MGSYKDMLIGVVVIPRIIVVDQTVLSSYFKQTKKTSDELNGFSIISSTTLSNDEKATSFGDVILSIIPDENAGCTTVISAATIKSLHAMMMDFPEGDKNLFTEWRNLLEVIDEPCKQNFQLYNAEQELFLANQAFLLKADSKLFDFPSLPLDTLARLDDLRKHQIFAAEQHCYTVIDFDPAKPIYLGTTSIGSCMGLVAINQIERVAGIAHLDGPSIIPYQASLTAMFKSLIKSLDSAVDLYIIGGNEDSFVLENFGPLTKSRLLNFQEFLKDFPQFKIKSARLFADEETLEGFVVKLGNAPSFERLNDKTMKLVMKHERALIDLNKVVADPPSYRELVELKPISTRELLLAEHITLGFIESSSSDEENNVSAPSPKPARL